MSLWKQDETQTEARRNREAIIGRLRLPVYDVTPGNGITLLPLRIQTTLTTNPTPLYAVSGTPATRKCVVHSIQVFNNDIVSRPVTLNVVPPALAATDANAVFKGTLLTKERLILAAPWFLPAGATIVGGSNANSVLSLSIESSEYDADPVGASFATIAPVAMGTADGTFYTVPSTGVTHAVLLAITVVNVSGVTATPTVYRRLGADALGAVSQIILGEPIPAGDLVIDDTPRILYGGESIGGHVSVAAATTIHLTVMEFA